jgi:hypothetical protein
VKTCEKELLDLPAHVVSLKPQTSELGHLLEIPKWLGFPWGNSWEKGKFLGKRWGKLSSLSKISRKSWEKTCYEHFEKMLQIMGP